MTHVQLVIDVMSKDGKCIFDGVKRTFNYEGIMSSTIRNRTERDIAISEEEERMVAETTGDLAIQLMTMKVK